MFNLLVCGIGFGQCHIFRSERGTVSSPEKTLKSASKVSLSFRNSISLLLYATAESLGSETACHDYYWLAFPIDRKNYLNLILTFYTDLKVPILKTGRYRHYKGKDYIVIGVALHSETEEELVVYRTDYGDRGLWVRPKAMFMDTIDQDGERIPRFQFIEENETA